MILEYPSAALLLGLVWQQLWIGVALVIVVAVSLKFGKGWNAATRHWIWALTLVAVALLPLAAWLPQTGHTVFTATIPFESLSALPESSAVTTALLPEETSPAGPHPGSELTAAWGNPFTIRILASILLASWLCGSAWMLVRLLRSARAAGRLRAGAEPASIPGHSADVRLSSAISSPMVVGLRQPCILLPASMREQVRPEVLDRLLRHELAHLHRRDHWIMLGQRLVEALYFFHPGVRFAARRLEDEREISCDDFAAREDRNRYAASLVQVCRDIVIQKGALPLAVGALCSRRQLARRVSQLVNTRHNYEPRVSGPALTMASAVVIMLVAGATELMPRVSHAEEPPGGQPYSISYAADAPFGPSLMAAVEYGDLDAANLLLDHGANPNLAVDGDGTPLIIAARAGDEAMVRLFLEYGAEIDAGVEGDGNPLIMAAAHGKTDIVRILLNYDADIDAVVPGDENALISAARAGQYDAVRLLLERGADVDIVVPAMRLNGKIEQRTALNQARANGHKDIEQLLLEHGATR